VSTANAVPAHIFREYDIRGIVGVDFTPEIVEGVGRAYGTLLVRALRDSGEGRTPAVAVGGDNRPTSEELVRALLRGLNGAGVDVLNLGTVPTPVAYWAEKALGTDGAIQITGSHNPPEWNGIKMTFRGAPFYGVQVQRLREMIVKGDFLSGAGETTLTPVLERYIDDLVGRFALSRPVHAVVDCGNGTGSLVAVELLERLGVRVTPLYCESDGTFPNHHPDPTVDENLEELIAEVRRTEADLGIAFDGDADRIGCVDDRGQIIRGDTLMLLFGLDLLRRRGPGQLLIYDVKCSQLLPELFEGAGGRSLMWKTGHSLIKEKMRETGAQMGGELSGHICFADDFIGTDDALYAACRISALVADAAEPLSAQVGAFPTLFSTPEVRIEVREEEKEGIVSAAVTHFGGRYPVLSVDGVRVLFPEGWALLRASNTQPVLVARFEAKSPTALAAIRAEMEEWLRGRGVEV